MSLQTAPATNRRASRPVAGRVLLVDDDSDQVTLLGAMLAPMGVEVTTAGSAEQALQLVNRQSFEVVVTDLNLPGASGIDLTRELRKRVDSPSVVVITGGGSLAQAIEALKVGASDYLQKPMDPGRLLALVKELLGASDVRESTSDDDSARTDAFEGMFGRSRVMQDVFSRILRVAPTGAPVLIVGESGTGKELVARALHVRSRRPQGAFVPVHTGAIPRELIASDLFGHEKGAFTGALSAAEGKFEAAEGGTLFLDEVGTMDVATQISLLRVLETYRFTRVGATREKQADVRILAATNRDLLDLVEARQFREDLYFRLNVFTIALPPLRDRGEDVVPIAERFLRSFANRYETPARDLGEGAAERLRAYAWPGNVRELRNVMEQTAVFARRPVVQADDIQLVSTRIARWAPSPRVHDPYAIQSAAPPEDVQEAPASAPIAHESHGEPTVESDWFPPIASSPPLPAPIAVVEEDHPMVLRIAIGTSCAEVERLLIMKTLEASKGNKQAAARILGISRRGLYTKLTAFGEHVPAEELADIEPGPENAN